MIRKSFKVSYGIKATKETAKRKVEPHKPHKTIDSEERIRICLSCNKPVSECKGSCFGRKS